MQNCANQILFGLCHYHLHQDLENFYKKQKEDKWNWNKEEIMFSGNFSVLKKSR